MVIAALLLLVAADPAAGDATKVKRICKAIPQTGTRLGRTRECHTQAQWDALARQQQQDNQDMLNRPGSTPGG